MNIVVLIKQVPDMEQVRFDSEKGVVDRKSAGVEINPFDLNALEAAIQISEKTGAKVTAITMGPPKGEEALREAIARGVHEGILLSDKAFGGADTKATSLTLAAAIKQLGQYDLVIAGEKTVDGDTGQVGAETAEYLDIPHVSYVNKVLDVNDDYICLVSEIWGSHYVKKVQYPALFTVTKDINVPRLPSIKSKMAARKAEITTWTIDNLSNYINADVVGGKGSPTKVKKIEVPPEVKRECKIYRENITEFIDDMTTILKRKKFLEV